ncbi:MAG: EamA family transporter RarD [Akkermansiaceae bacterium]|nr:EamA family transporter RarD [Akkermansiaceae bacterium]
MNPSRSGVLAAIAAFFLWGVLPVFWKLLHFLPPISIVAQRTLWSLVILLLILRLRRETGSLSAGLRSPRAVFWHLLSGVMLSSNWLLYIWATLNDHIIEGALGYYLNPFFNMLFGALWFGERHNRGQLAAIAIAFCGVLLQVQAIGRFPWIAVTLAVTFSLYAVIRKRTPLGSLAGLTAETVLLAPLALGWLILHSSTPADAFGTSPSQFLLVAATGVATAAPLLCFGYAARKISLTTLGILQFIGPTIQFLIGWLLYQEEMGSLRLASFALIWAAVLIYAWDAMRARRTPVA